MATPIIYGPDYSTYVRTVRLAHEEKPVEYRLEPVHILGGEAQQPGHLQRHPFGKVPAFEHDGFTLYETTAIVRYVDRVFAPPSYQSSSGTSSRSSRATGSGGAAASPERPACNLLLAGRSSAGAVLDARASPG